MGFVKEFKIFILRGNVLDLAVGVIVGAAFGKIINSLVNDLLMPPLGKILGGVDFKDLFISLDPSKTARFDSLAKARETGAAIIAYGQFLNVVVDFLIVAFCIFLMIKIANRFQAKKVDDPSSKECPRCLLQVALRATRCPHCTSDL
jgi:large conductance mechanosensitive channel